MACLWAEAGAGHRDERQGTPRAERGAFEDQSGLDQFRVLGDFFDGEELVVVARGVDSPDDVHNRFEYAHLERRFQRVPWRRFHVVDGGFGAGVWRFDRDAWFKAEDFEADVGGELHFADLGIERTARRAFKFRELALRRGERVHAEARGDVDAHFFDVAFGRARPFGLEPEVGDSKRRVPGGLGIEFRRFGGGTAGGCAGPRFPLGDFEGTGYRRRRQHAAQTGNERDKPPT